MKNRKAALAISACLLVQLCAGIIYLWGVFNTPVAAALKISTSLVSSVMLFAFVFGCLIGGFINDKKGPRYTVTIGMLIFGVGVGSTGLLRPEIGFLINFTYAVMGGLGAGFAYTSCMSCIQKWFPNRTGFASGLAATSFGLSTVVFTPLSHVLMTHFTDAATGIIDIRPVFLILGGIFLALGLGASLFICLPETVESGCQEKKSEGISAFPDDMSPLRVIKTRHYWLVFFSIFFGVGAWTLTVPLVFDLGMARGLSHGAAALTVSLTGIVNAAGRLLISAMSDHLGRCKAMMMVSGMTIAGSVLVIFAGGGGYIAAVLVIAFAYGGPGPLAAAFAVDFFGAKNSARNFGLITLSLGFSSLVCNTVSVYFLKGDVGATFIIAAVMAAIPISLMRRINALRKSM